ncbi:MAG: twin-arginine translocase subunit TatB [Acetobacteraceae bacterium]|nr:twin-arginine translocase subunit TatB [Acetobacteraceae bacterium]
MFDLAWSEIALIGVVALIVIGPKDLPGAIRGVAQMLGKARRMAGEFQTHVDEMVREAKLDEVKREIDQFRSNIQNEVYKATQVDELKRDIVDPLKDTVRDLERPLDQPAAATQSAPAAATPADGTPAPAPQAAPVAAEATLADAGPPPPAPAAEPPAAGPLAAGPAMPASPASPAATPAAPAAPAAPAFIPPGHARA